MKAEATRALFDLVLDVVGTSLMVNEVIEITLTEPEDTYEITRYDLPAPSMKPFIPRR